VAEKSSDHGLYAVVWPRGERKQTLRPLARRLDTLNGKTVAQLWDYLFAGGWGVATWKRNCANNIRREIRQLARIRSTHGVNEKELLAALPQRFRELGVDAAISSMAC